MFAQPHKALSLFLISAFISSSLYIPKVQAGEMVVPVMPKPGTMVDLSPAFTPAHLKGIMIHPDNALQFDFLIDKGEGNLNEAQKKDEYNKLIKYFLASLTVADKDQWVNLSPFEHDRIIEKNFGETEMGRDLLAQDYLLKQITSSLMYPESGLGKSFWDKVYEKAHNELGTTNIPVDTFNKVWIVPSSAVIHENGNTAYIVKSHLKVMLEEDYLSLKKHTVINVGKNQTHAISSKVIKDVILPILEEEVNEGKNFAQLRQVFSGMILASWYKAALKESLLGKVYADKAKVQGVNQDPANNEKIYQEYLQAFKKGVYNYVKEDADKYTKEVIPRKYFAGGFNKAAMTLERAQVSAGEIANDVINNDRIEAVNTTFNADSAMSIERFKSNLIGMLEKLLPGDSRIKDISVREDKNGFHVSIATPDMPLELAEQFKAALSKIFPEDTTITVTPGNIDFAMKTVDKVLIGTISAAVVGITVLILSKTQMMTEFSMKISGDSVASLQKEALELKGEELAKKVLNNLTLTKRMSPEDLAVSEAVLLQSLKLAGLTGTKKMPEYLDKAHFLRRAPNGDLIVANDEVYKIILRARIAVDGPLPANQAMTASQFKRSLLVALKFLRLNGAQSEIVKNREKERVQTQIRVVKTKLLEAGILDPVGAIEQSEGLWIVSGLKLEFMDELTAESAIYAALRDSVHVYSIRPVNGTGTYQVDFRFTREMSSIPYDVNRLIYHLLQTSKMDFKQADGKVIVTMEIPRLDDGTINRLEELVKKTLPEGSELSFLPGRIDFAMTADQKQTLTRMVVVNAFIYAIFALSLAKANIESTIKRQQAAQIRAEVEKELKNDKAMIEESPVGGIDMNAANMDMQIKRDGKGVPLPLMQQDMAQLEGIAGFVPNIIEIRPAAALPVFNSPLK